MKARCHRMLLAAAATGLVATAGFAAGSAELARVPKAPVKILLWTQESEAGALPFVQKLTGAFTARFPNLTLEVQHKEADALLQELLAAGLSQSGPNLLWAAGDLAGPLSAARVIQPVDSFVDLGKYLPSVVVEGKTWGVPISSGDHLMLIYNKDLVKAPPKTTNELITLGTSLTAGRRYAIAWDQTAALWLIPWLGGFGGSVFASDGRTPTLNTRAMVDALQFLSDLKRKYAIAPPQADYATSDALFRDGRAAMLINGDWSLDDYRHVLGGRLGVAPLPRVSATGMWPAPYASGPSFMVPARNTGDTLAAAIAYVRFVTSYESQVDLVKSLGRLPALRTALGDRVVQGDPVLRGSAAQVVLAIPTPSVAEMRAVWDAIKPEMNAVFLGTESPGEAAKAMQDSAEKAIGGPR